MPTILTISGWRLFFYANERHEPAHVHARKGNAECKFWLLIDKFDIEEAYSYGLSPADNRTIRRIILENFDRIALRYQAFHEGREM